MNITSLFVVHQYQQQHGLLETERTIWGQDALTKAVLERDPLRNTLPSFQGQLKVKIMDSNAPAGYTVSDQSKPPRL